ncbi:MAG: hypothetical protein SGI74_08700 [Oligoflexia bacterium]|nr:hypothetical protein [Oligoflexia bacterium]
MWNQIGWGYVFIFIQILASSSLANIDSRNFQPTPISVNENFIEQQCDNEEVLRRVCGEGGFRTPTTFDSTGIGFTYLQLRERQNYRSYKKPQEELISIEGARRFNQIYKSVNQEYVYLFTRLVPENRSALNRRLAELGLSSREFNNYFLDNGEKNFSQRIQEKFWHIDHALRCKNLKHNHQNISPGAYYHPESQTVLGSTAMLNEPLLSEATLFFVLAHEIGHHLDPININKDYRVQKVFWPIESIRCFAQSHYLGSFQMEEFADWVASIILEQRLLRIADALNKKRYAQNAVKFFCDGITSESTNFVHPPNRDRVVRFFRQPGLRKAIGCVGKIIENTREVRACGVAYSQDMPKFSINPK